MSASVYQNKAKAVPGLGATMARYEVWSAGQSAEGHRYTLGRASYASLFAGSSQGLERSICSYSASCSKYGRISVRQLCRGFPSPSTVDRVSRGQAMVIRFIVQQGKPDVLEVVDTFHAPRGLSRTTTRRKEHRDQYPDNGDDREHFNKPTRQRATTRLLHWRFAGSVRTFIRVVAHSHQSRFLDAGCPAVLDAIASL